MSDPVTALKNATATGPVTVAETGPHGMLTLRGKLDDAGIAKAIQTATGTAAPSARKLSASGEVSVLWFSPDEALVICPRADLTSVQQKLTSALGSAHALVADMSDARATFRISGEDAHVREVMARLIPVDMSLMQVGDVRRTRMAQIATAIWMPEAGVVQLVCFRSVAQYAFDLLKEAAASPRVF